MASSSRTLTEKMLSEHRVRGELTPGETVEIDQVLLQDVLGPLVWIGFEALGFDEVKTDVADPKRERASDRLGKRRLDVRGETRSHAGGT